MQTAEVGRGDHAAVRRWLNLKQDADQFYHAHGEAVLSGWKASIVAAQSGGAERGRQEM